MIPFWRIIYGLAWVIWFICVIGGLGNQKLLSLFSQESGFQYSPQYINGIELAQMGGDSQINDIAF